MTMTMTMTMKISLFDINHLNTMIRENKAEKNNVVNEQETIQNNIKCRYRRPTYVINNVCDKYPVNFNNICLLCYTKGNHSCKYK